MIKTAILFKTHFWSREVELNFESVIVNSRNSDIYIILDNNNSEIIPEKFRKSYNVLNYTKEKALEIGLMISEANEGGFWYNGDYHQNIFIKYHTQYDYICSVEHDVYVDKDIDKIFLRMLNENIDVVCKIQKIPNSNWSHLGNCIGYYDVNKYINKGLFCISFFSKRSSYLILNKRLEMASLKKEEGISSWPIGECVMIHEPIIANHNVLDLEKFCSSLSMYDWAPSYLHSQIKKFSNSFYHPVSNLEKYLYTNFHQPYNCFATGDEAHISKSMVEISHINNYFIYAEAYSNTSNIELKSEIISNINKLINIFDKKWLNISYKTNISNLENIYFYDYMCSIPTYGKYIEINSENNEINIFLDNNDGLNITLSIMTSSEIICKNQEFICKKISDDLFLTNIICSLNEISLLLSDKSKVFGMFFSEKYKINFGNVKFENIHDISHFSKNDTINAYILSYDYKEKIVTIVVNSVYRQKIYCHNFNYDFCRRNVSIDLQSGVVKLIEDK